MGQTELQRHCQHQNTLGASCMGCKSSVGVLMLTCRWPAVVIVLLVHWLDQHH